MDKVIQRLAREIQTNDVISPELFAKFNVKRGLRNEDGSGVLVGLTEICSVIGYTRMDEELVPVPGRLFYRGIDVVDILAAQEAEDRSVFEETAYLLLAGQLPTAQQLEDFRTLLAQLRPLPRNFVRDQLSTFRTRNIMNALARSVLALYAVDKNAEDMSLENLVRQSVELVAKVPSIVAYAYRVFLERYRRKSLIIHQPKPELGVAENFLHLIRDDGEFDPLEARVLDAAMVLHADHGGGNNSTFAARVVTSSGTDTYSAIAAAIGSLKGPLHGGANLFVANMMQEIKKNVKDWSSEQQVRDYLLKILKKEAGDGSGKLYGFGHAVYTLSDPRAEALKQWAHKLAAQKGRLEEYQFYELVEHLAPRVFAEFKNTDKPMCANVDFYSGFVYDCLGLPKEIFTPLFAMARVAGWVAHRIEEIVVQRKIIRPAYKSVIAPRPYVALSQRG